MSPIFLSLRRCGRINVFSDFFHSLIRIFSNIFGTLWVDGGYCSKFRVQFRGKSNGMLWTAKLSFKLISFTIFEMSMNILNLKIGIYHKITSLKKCRRIIEPVRQPLPPPMIIYATSSGEIWANSNNTLGENSLKVCEKNVVKRRPPKTACCCCCCCVFFFWGGGCLFSFVICYMYCFFCFTCQNICPLFTELSNYDL